MSSAPDTGPAPDSAGAGRRAPVDVRQQLAADRTLLAWIRTATALAALGFVVARFNLFLNEVDRRPAGQWGEARVLGLAMVAASAVLLVVGMVQHRQVSAVLASHGDPMVAPRWPAPAGASFALLAVVAVAVYLATGVS